MACTALGPNATPAPISAKEGADSKMVGFMWACGRSPMVRARPARPPPMMARFMGAGGVGWAVGRWEAIFWVAVVMNK